MSLSHLFIGVTMKLYHFIYLTHNLINGKIYVGVHSANRLKDSYLGSGDNILKAIKKYGKNNFQRHILHLARNEEEAYEIESWIVDRSFLSRTDVYNLTPGGYRPPNRKGRSPSKEHRQKIGDANRNPSEETRAKKRIAATSISNETREKRSKSLSGRVVSVEERAKNSRAQTGKTLSNETKRKISDSLRGVPKPQRSEEHCRKISEANKGKHIHSDEHKAYMSKIIKQRRAEQRESALIGLVAFLFWK